MTARVEVLSCGPLITVQDRGRPGYLHLGLARGGAADRRALDEAMALLGRDGAGFELQASAARLRTTEATSVALTGRPMRAALEGRGLRWGACHDLGPGQVLEVRPEGAGYSYLHFGGGLLGDPVMGSLSAHAIAGIGRTLRGGDAIAFRPRRVPARALLDAPDRFDGGVLRCVPGPQTRLFPAEEITRFLATIFVRDPRGNRQGVRLDFEGPGFETADQLGLLSDFILPGDVQMTGDGTPFVLGPECQTTGGYPRIATVIEADLPRAMQAPPGARISFRMVDRAEALAARPGPPAAVPLVRDPRDMDDLLSHQLVSGVVSATDSGGES